MSDELEIEYAVCYGGIEAGMRVLNRDLAPRPGCVDAYHGALDEYRKKGSQWARMVAPVPASPK